MQAAAHIPVILNITDVPEGHALSLIMPFQIFLKQLPADVRLPNSSHAAYKDGFTPLLYPLAKLPQLRLTPGKIRHGSYIGIMGDDELPLLVLKQRDGNMPLTLLRRIKMIYCLIAADILLNATAFKTVVCFVYLIYIVCLVFFVCLIFWVCLVFRVCLIFFVCLAFCVCLIFFVCLSFCICLIFLFCLLSHGIPLPVLSQLFNNAFSICTSTSRISGLFLSATMLKNSPMEDAIFL